MSHFTKCFLMILSGILLAAGVAMTLAAEKNKREKLKNAGYVICTIGVFGYIVFGFLLLVTLRFGMMLVGIMVSAPVAVAVIALHYGISETVKKPAARKLLRVLLTIAHFAIYVLCAFPIARGEKQVSIPLALLCSVVLAAVYFIGKWIRKKKRAKVLVDSPVMKQALLLCKSGECVAVQILADRIRLFDRLPNPQYCKSEDHSSASLTLTPPWWWKSWLEGEGCFREVMFKDYDYPELKEEQMQLCAKGLVSALRGFGSAHHTSTHRQTTKAVYDESRNSYVKTTYVTKLFEDYLVFRLADFRAAERERQEAQKGKASGIQTAGTKGNSWE